MKRGSVHPMDAKIRFAHEMVRSFHGVESAIDAENHWKKVHREREIPDRHRRVSHKRVTRARWLPGLLKEIGMVPSTSEGRRVIEQGGVYVAGQRRPD